MDNTQTGILSEENTMARYLSFSIVSSNDVASSLKSLISFINTEDTVIGVGLSLVNALGVNNTPELTIFSAQSENGIDIPATPAALWCWLRGTDRGELFHRSREIETLLSQAFVLNDVTDSSSYDSNRDLSGYEDGTENPKGSEAAQVAITQGKGDGLDGGSYVAVQQWVHDFDVLDEMTTEKKDDAIGRHIKDNEEFDEAPESAHVKRSAQESFDPEAFMLRRSMPWVEGMDGGLMFVAFAKSFQPFEMILDHMLGKDDSTTDGIFSFTRPVTGAYYWCPPTKDGKLDLSVLGL
jgi:porphyrinogen peroxidase